MLRFTVLRFLLPATLLFHGAPSLAKFEDPLITPARQTQRLTSSPMTAVVNAGGGRLVAAGWRGLIAVSEDAGKTWRQAAVPVREDLTALAFPTPTHGWAVGNDGVVLESTDGGLTWVKRLDGNAAARLMANKYEKLSEQNPSDVKLKAALKDARDYLTQAPARPFLDIAFQNEQVGYLVGTFGMIFRTSDGGKTWEPLIEKTDNPDGYNIYCVRIVGDDVFLVGELGLALRLDRGTGQFVKMSVPYDGSMFALGGNASSLVAAGLRGNAFLSSDDGTGWKKIEFGAGKPATVASVAMIGDRTIALATLSGDLLISTDAGQSFHRAQIKAPMKYAGIARAGANDVVVVGLQGIRIETIK